MQMSNPYVDDYGEQASRLPAKVGYGCPPVHSQFKPGQSGNPSGRAKGGQNLKTLFNKILSEEVSLREGAGVKKVSKAEAVLRGVVLGALKGDPRSMAMLLRLDGGTKEGIHDRRQQADAERRLGRRIAWSRTRGT